jgi:hypothetical protein
MQQKSQKLAIKPAGIERTPLREMRLEHARILEITIENWLFDWCHTCGQPHCAHWCIDLFDDYPEQDP